MIDISITEKAEKKRNKKKNKLKLNAKKMHKIMNENRNAIKKISVNKTVKYKTKKKNCY